MYEERAGVVTMMTDDWRKMLTAPRYSRAEREAARLKSYNGHVILVIILYLFLFIPGLIANGIFYTEAKRMEDIAGEPLPGVAALGFMRKWLFILMLLFVVVVGSFALLALLRGGL